MPNRNSHEFRYDEFCSDQDSRFMSAAKVLNSLNHTEAVVALQKCCAAPGQRINLNGAAR